MAEKEQKDAAKPAGKKKLIVLIAAVLIALGGGAGGAYFYMKDKPVSSAEAKAEEHKEEEHAQAEKEPPVIVPLDIFTANLQPADSEKYLQVSIALKFAGGKEGGHGEGGNDAIKPFIPDIRNAVLTKMAELKPEDVTGNAAREQLRTSLKEAIEKVLPAAEKKKFTEVLFTQFVVQ